MQKTELLKRKKKIQTTELSDKEFKEKYRRVSHCWKKYAESYSTATEPIQRYD